MQRLKLTVNAEKTRCCRVPEESIEFLGYRIGRNYRRDTGRAYIGTRPSQASVQRICRKVSEVTATRYGLLEPEGGGGRLNRLITGWANYFCLGQVSPAYATVDRHTTRRLRRWLCRKHKVRFGKYVRLSDAKLWEDRKLARLGPANGQLSVGEGMISSESPMREIRTLGSPSGDWKRSHGAE